MSTFIVLVAAGLVTPVAASAGDATSLVQNRLSPGNGAVAVNESANSSWNSSDWYKATPPPTPPPESLFRFVFTKTWGASYVCNGDIEFFDEASNKMEVVWRDQTSCYGCALDCNGCAATYGNPLAQFNGSSDWSCTAPGRMNGGSKKNEGEEIVTFKLGKRPTRYKFSRSKTGDFIPREWQLEERTPWPEHKWVVLDGQTGEPNTIFWGEVKTDGLTVKNFNTGCPGAPFEMESDPESQSPEFNYKPSRSLVLMNNGNGGMNIDGDFGEVVLGDNFGSWAGSWHAKQLSFEVPTSYSIDGVHAVGQMRIIHQSKFDLAKVPRLLVIVVMLKLPKEGGDERLENFFFKSIGMEELPVGGGTYKDIYQGVDLYPTFSRSLSSTYSWVDCNTSSLQWLVFSEPALISGSVFSQFLTVQQKAATEWCGAGVKGPRRVCCQAACGKCGGSTCAGAPGGPAECCSSDVAAKAIVCETMDSVGCTLPDENATVPSFDPLSPADPGFAEGAPTDTVYPLHPGHAQYLPEPNWNIASDSGEWMPALKGGVSVDPDEEDSGEDAM